MEKLQLKPHAVATARAVVLCVLLSRALCESSDRTRRTCVLGWDSFLAHLFFLLCPHCHGDVGEPRDSMLSQSINYSDHTNRASHRYECEYDEPIGGYRRRQRRWRHVIKHTLNITGP